MTAAEKLTAQARIEAEAAFLLRQLTRRFGPLSPEHTSRVQRATPDELERWGDRVLSAATLDEILAD